MSIIDGAFMVCPVLGALLGYLVDGVSGAMSGVLIPAGPLLLAWMLQTR